MLITIWLALLLSPAQAAGTAPFRLHALDVGEGQALLVQRGSRGILVDTGHAGQATIVLDALRSLGVSRAVVLDNHRPLSIMVCLAGSAGDELFQAWLPDA